MKLLFDQNLSRHLVEQLRDEFPESIHVTTVRLSAATDREIWDFAGAGGYVIVSKDSDFRQLAFLFGPPPKAIWLNVGNLSTAAIRELLTSHLPMIERFESSEDEALLVLRRLAGLPFVDHDALRRDVDDVIDPSL